MDLPGTIALLTQTPLQAAIAVRLHDKVLITYWYRSTDHDNCKALSYLKYHVKPIVGAVVATTSASSTDKTMISNQRIDVARLGSFLRGSSKLHTVV